ncbi:hypothetical protein [Aquitalea magnusonii]|uniref:hypothetical protein n=1 Tax=Aquitalea magnusonii TaxID=332411 RepID=UPI000B5C987E|nr:hypothetical protein [Aquitalea magnusonii]
MKFINLETVEIKNAIKKINNKLIIEVLEEGVMPEADVLLCKYLGRRINIKVDLDYGAEICGIDVFSDEEINELEKIIIENK